MISKNSFLVNMKENLKRRKGIAVLYSIIFLLVYPVGLTLFTVSTKGYMSLNPNYRDNLTESYALYLGMNIATILFVTLLAVICALQGFSYLFKKQKLDMYLSVPVSKERRFAVIYVNGILLYALPYLASILVSLCIGAGNGVYVGKIIKTIIFSYLSYLIYYLAIYNIAIIVVMLTGNILVAFCGVAVFLLYEGGIRAILEGMSSMYFHTYSSYTDEALYRMTFSPVLFLAERLLDMDSLAGQNVPYLLEEFGVMLAKTAVIAVITGIAAYLLYSVRPAESCNKAIAFKKTRPFIKVALMVPIGLVTGILFYAIADSTAMTILGFLLGIFLCHGILEVIFEFDLKAMFGSFPSMIAGAVLVFAVYAVFEFDLTGYDKWVPKPEQVESVAVNSYVLADNSIYDVEDECYVSNGDYALERMKITDTERFCKLMDAAIDEWGEWNNAEDGQGKIFAVTVKYRMKNGKEKYRRIFIDYEEHKEELNWLMSCEEFQKGTFQILDEEFMDRVSLERISFSNGITGSEIEKEDMEKVLQAYKEDLKQHYKMELVAEQYPAGIIDFQFSVQFDLTEEQYNTREITMYYALPVYEEYEKTMAYVKENDLFETWIQDVENIDEITISHYSEEYGEWMNKEFIKTEEKEAILPALIPGEIGKYKLFTEEESNEYTVTVSYTGENEAHYESNYFDVLTDLLPDFAK